MELVSLVTGELLDILDCLNPDNKKAEFRLVDLVVHR